MSKWGYLPDLCFYIIILAQLNSFKELPTLVLEPRGFPVVSDRPWSKSSNDVGA